MKIEYDVPVDKVQSKPTGEHTQSLKDFIASDRDNMLLDFENDIETAKKCQRLMCQYIERNELYQFRVARRKAKVYVIREGKT